MDNKNICIILFNVCCDYHYARVFNLLSDLMFVFSSLDRAIKLDSVLVCDNANMNVLTDTHHLLMLSFLEYFTIVLNTNIKKYTCGFSAHILKC